MASKLEIKDVLIESESGNYSEDSDAMQSTAEQRQRLFRSENWHEVRGESNYFDNEAKSIFQASIGDSAIERQLSNSIHRWNVLALSGNGRRTNLLRSRKHHGGARRHASRGPLGDSIQRDFHQFKD
mmetsp:Transcript_32417/g.45189  ORF Transcript_32417/g.45189 Transcript_32417/m.45189 type:complete len:127 (-) Transcript_32417:567-947(-)